VSFEERLALMVDREVYERADKRHPALLKRARLKYPLSCTADIDSRAGLVFERTALMRLALSRWVEDGTSILVPEPIGSASRGWPVPWRNASGRGQSALYLRVPRLTEELRILHGNGGLTRWLAAVSRTDLLLLDDRVLASMDGPIRADLMEVIDDRAGTRAMIITSQLPVERWYAWIYGASIADARQDGQPRGLPTRPPTCRRLPASSTGPDHRRFRRASNTSNSPCAAQVSQARQRPPRTPPTSPPTLIPTISNAQNQHRAPNRSGSRNHRSRSPRYTMRRSCDCLGAGLVAR